MKRITHFREPRIKYKEYGRYWARKCIGNGAAGTKFGKYVSKLDVLTNLYVIDDSESKTTYKLALAERRAFSDVHKEFGSIREWYESVDKETQAKIIRIPFDNKMKEGSLPEGSEAR